MTLTNPELELITDAESAAKEAVVFVDVDRDELVTGVPGGVGAVGSIEFTIECWCG